ncbi:MAG: hypothetical protein SOY45_07930 [Lachnospiraceae bacterium]|nr:hypothetical protein [Lachnospiraceae bacterium]MDY4069791.1 hypothetical protein [Lachnospiraceae bacterium]
MTNRTDKMQQTERKEWNLRPLTELNLIEDFLTNQMIIHPVVGLRFSKRVLTTILGREIGTLSIAVQKAYPGENTDRHGIRLDVCLDEQGGGIVDLEPDQNSSAEDVASLPRRVRFYHAKIDAGSLARGMEYSALRNVVVIFITTYDPFGLNRMVYTISNKCEEVPEMPYDDGAKTLFLYTKGTAGNPPEALKQLLHYMEDTRAENAVTPELRELHEMVTQVKCDKEVGLAYMKAYEIEQRLLRQGSVLGEEKKLLNQIIGKVKKGKSIPEIAEALDEDEVLITKRVEIVNRYAPDYDLEAILDEVMNAKR